MDGWHRLRVPALIVSLFLQGVTVFLLIHASDWQSREMQTEALTRAELRLERLATYRWEMFTCLLLSMSCMSLLLVSRRPTENTDAGAYRNLKMGLHELEHHLKTQEEADRNLIQNLSENMKVLSERSQGIYGTLVSSHDELQKVNNRLGRVMEQGRECSNLSSQTRIDWKKTKVADPLAQLRQNLDNLLDLSKNLSSTHSSTLRLLHETLQSGGILHDKIGRAQEHLERMHGSAYQGSKVHDSIYAIIMETRDNISGAHKFVLSLLQKWDQLLQLTEQIDGVARQINTQSLAASLEMAHAQPPGAVTDLFPFGNELRMLAAQFHTFAHHIKDAVHDGRDELQKTAQYLSQATSKSDYVLAPVHQCGEHLRNSVAAVKYAGSELTLLQQEVNIHMNRLQETYNMGMNTADTVGSMDRFLLNHSSFSRKVLEETGQTTLHSDRMATLLAKQHHELNHCQKILARSGPLLSESMRFATELKQTVATMEMCLEKAQPKREEDILPVGQNKKGEVQVTCWKISSR